MDIDLPGGDRRLPQTIVAWSAPKYAWGSHPSLVELTASIESDPELRGRPSAGSTATTLAIQLDARAGEDWGHPP